MSQYVAVGTSVVLAHFTGESRIAAELADHASAKQAAKLLNRARHLNDVRRKYTASARTIMAAESLPSFRWID